MIIHFKGFNTTLIQSKQYTENKIRTVDSAANENSKSINLVNQAIRKLERQVCTFNLSGHECTVWGSKLTKR